MTLDPHTQHPSDRSYVLKLHRDAAPERGCICGRLEHIASGRACRFGNADELMACLARDAAMDPDHDNPAP